MGVKPTQTASIIGSWQLVKNLTAWCQKWTCILQLGNPLAEIGVPQQKGAKNKRNQIGIISFRLLSFRILNTSLCSIAKPSAPKVSVILWIMDINLKLLWLGQGSHSGCSGHSLTNICSAASNDIWISMRAIQLCLIDTGSNTRSLLVLLSPWKQALEHVATALQGVSVGIISTRTRAWRVLAAATIWGWHLFCSELFFYCCHLTCPCLPTVHC